MGVAHAFLALTAAVPLLSYIKFCLEYPFVRVEHIRHVLPLIPLFAALAGKRAPGGRGGGLRCGVEFALDSLRFWVEDCRFPEKLARRAGEIP